MTQVRLQDICEEIVDEVEGALGCALVSLATGLPLALDVKPASLLNARAMEMISAAGVSYFHGNSAMPLGPDSSAKALGHAMDYTQEIQSTTEDTYNFMSLVPGEEQELLILITDRRTTNLGLGWMSMWQALDRVQYANGNDAAETPGTQATATPDPLPTLQQPSRRNSEFVNPRVRDAVLYGASADGSRRRKLCRSADIGFRPRDAIARIADTDTNTMCGTGEKL